MWPVTNFNSRHAKISYRYLYNIWPFSENLFSLITIWIGNLIIFSIKFYKNYRSMLI